jgi:phosphotransferase system  glucose/maltose/N-acetylglucosamine-specific IIC component
MFPYVAFVGSVAFGLVHVYWLLGGGIGLPGGESMYNSPMVPAGESSTLLVVIDVIAIPVSAMAALLALSLDDSGPWIGLSRRARLAAAWAVTALCALHAAPTVPDWFALAVGTRTVADLTVGERFLTFGYEPVFLAGAVAFGLAALHKQKDPDRTTVGSFS